MCRTRFTLYKPGTPPSSEEPGVMVRIFVDLPARAIIGDFVYLSELLPAEMAERAEHEWLYDELCEVSCTSWHKDAEGIYLSAELELGE